MNCWMITFDSFSNLYITCFSVSRSPHKRQIITDRTDNRPLLVVCLCWGRHHGRSGCLGSTQRLYTTCGNQLQELQKLRSQIQCERGRCAYVGMNAYQTSEKLNMKPAWIYCLNGERLWFACSIFCCVWLWQCCIKWTVTFEVAMAAILAVLVQKDITLKIDVYCNTCTQKENYLKLKIKPIPLLFTGK